MEEKPHLYLFDLDDTLLSSTGKVPRQTWWLLARLAKEGHLLGIVSNNPLLGSVAAGVGLTSYIPTERLLTRARKEETRAELIRRWLALCEPDYAGTVYYYDDRPDQVAQVNAAEFGPGVRVVATLVGRPEDLFSKVAS
jgi:FMN phosphatase YigB (HAD superfamily)